jgi:drug/metabolite transporter (DMT)-like permease
MTLLSEIETSSHVRNLRRRIGGIFHGAEAGERGRIGLGIFFMVVATSMFPFMNGAVILLSDRYESDQIIWARVTSHLVFMLLLLLPREGMELFRTRQLGPQIKRSFAQLMSTSFYFTSVKFLNLAQATAISFTTPFIVTLLAVPILGEKIVRHRVFAMLVAFAGVLVIIRPGTSVFHWASMGVLCSAFFYALYQVYTRGVAGYDKPGTSVVYSVLLATVVMSVIMLFRWKTPESWTDIGLMCSLGIFGGLGHWSLAKAMTYAPANVVSPFQYWQLIGAVIIGYLITGNMPDAFVWLGAALIIAAGLYLAWKDTRVPEPQPKV